MRFADIIKTSPYFLENISSIRWVTINPPKILTDARTTAINPKVVERPAWSGPAAIRAPTIMTLEMALVTAISGECNAGVTFQTTYYPTKQASTNTVRAVSIGSTVGICDC